MNTQTTDTETTGRAAQFCQGGHDWQLRDMTGDTQHCVRCGTVRPSWTEVTA